MHAGINAGMNMASMWALTQAQTWTRACMHAWMDMGTHTLMPAQMDTGTHRCGHECMHAQTNAGTYGHTDAGTDACTGADAQTNAGMDVCTDTGMDAGTDMGMDAGTDMGIDVGTDTSTDAGMVLWTCLDLQGKPHLLVPELILPPSDPHPFPFPNTPVFTGPSARGLDASGMPRPTIVLICGTFVLTFCRTYCGLILICLLIQ
jgi:hypothetical protein